MNEIKRKLVDIESMNDKYNILILITYFFLLLFFFTVLLIPIIISINN